METSTCLCCCLSWLCRVQCCLLCSYSCSTKSSKWSFFSFVRFVCFSIIRCLGLFLEQSFFEEALDLTRGYKPITEKLVEPIQSLQIDTTNRFNHLSAYVAQVSRSIFSFLFSLRCAVLHRWLRKNGSTDRSMCRVILVFQIKSSNPFFLSKIFHQ